jgi:opacity protein-like surface antigen
MRKISLLCCALMMFTGFATAQVPTSGNVFFGYSYYNADLSSLGRSSLNGWTGSLEGKILPWVGLVADFSQTFGSEKTTIACPVGLACPVISINAHEYNMLFGPRVSVTVGKVRPFAEALFGVGHVSADAGANGSVIGAGSDTSLATGLGGGFDYRIVRPIALRLEGDYLQTRFFGSTQNNVRISTGIVFRF